MIGETLAHFKITGKLGEGGMGEVYRAEDTKLGRDVAIKVLPELFAQDEERMARFSREAQVLASLNHPNIAAIYQVEHDGDRHFLVMELAEGQTLEERLSSGPLALDDARARSGFPVFSSNRARRWRSSASSPATASPFSSVARASARSDATASSPSSLASARRIAGSGAWAICFAWGCSSIFV